MNAATKIKHQDYLLSINTKKEGEIKNGLPGVHVSPCFLDPENGIWVLYARFEPETLLPRHFHTGTVHFLTTAGSWNYMEYPEDVQTAGSYLFEPAGSIHTFYTKEGTEGFMVVQGANVNLNADDSLMFIMDAGWIENMLHTVAKETNQKVPRYIKPNASNNFSDSAE
ncbi:MAG: 2,4'-dihydroxyacetophenone dioxygenase family protein [Acinetobacter sp.]|nr:2,4'-dihydroxyacetophenone dioxygenase family protein [Acinetobacter sp.]